MIRYFASAASLAALLLLFSVEAHAQNVTFDFSDFIGEPSVFGSAESTVGDLTLVTNANSIARSMPGSNPPSPVNGFLFYPANANITDDGIVVNSASGGGPIDFTLLSIDFSNFNGSTFSVAGFLDGSSVFSQVITPTTGGTDVFETTNFGTNGAGFLVDSLTFTTNSIVGNFPSVDNVTISTSTAAIPEPTSLAFLGLGSIAMFVRRRRA